VTRIRGWTGPEGYSGGGAVSRNHPEFTKKNGAQLRADVTAWLSREKQMFHKGKGDDFQNFASEKSVMRGIQCFLEKRGVEGGGII